MEGKESPTDTSSNSESSEISESTNSLSVALMLKHFYLEQSLCPEFLKGVDAQLYSFLEQRNQFNLELHRILVNFTNVNPEHPINLTVATLDRSVSNRVLFVAGSLAHEAPVNLNHQRFIEYTGNEAQAGTDCYHYCALVITEK